MKERLNKHTLEILRPLSHLDRVGIFCDFDGTLTPIVNDPDDAAITAGNKKQLLALRDIISVIGIISGREVEDLAQRIEIDGLVYIGNHGLDRCRDGQRVVSKKVLPYLGVIQQAADAAEEILLPDMQLENKEATLSIHYRQTEDPDQVWAYARPRLEMIADQHGLKLFEGRMIFELRPPVEEDKGSAFADLIEEHQLDGAVFLGDDITDTAAFKTAAELKKEKECLAFSVGVQGKGTPDEVLELSDVNVPGVQGVEELLSWFASNLRASST